MRTIKFRAWDKHEKHMVDVDAIDFSYNQLCESMIWRPDADWYSLEYYELMQFTGLTDKHGKEIWEGDILGVDDPADTSRAIVVFHEGAFKPQLFRAAYIFDKSFLDWVVIGNVYEQPELLKGE